MAESRTEYCTDQCGSCREVIVRTYRGYRASGGDDPAAFRSAVLVLCLRHPERTQAENAELASIWISHALESDERGRRY